MSTKLHYGWRIALTGGPVALLRFVHRARAALRPVHRDLWQQTSVSGAVAYVDAVRFGLDTEFLANGSPFAGSPLLQMGHWLERQHAEDRSRRQIDLGFETVLLPDPDNEFWVYALVYTHQDRYLDVWRRLPGVTAWPYWDNSDPPEDIDEASWAHRRDVWGRVVGNDPPVVRGVTWTLLGEDIGFDGWTGITQRWPRFVPDDERRRQAVARMIVGQQTTVADTEDMSLVEFLRHRREQVALVESELLSFPVEPVTWVELAGTAAGFLSNFDKDI